MEVARIGYWQVTEMVNWVVLIEKEVNLSWLAEL